MKKSLLLAAAIAASLTSGVAAADVSANAGVFSNYIWRGVTQTNDQAAGQGGIDWSNDSGLYVGTWISNVQYPATGINAAGNTTVDFGGGYEMDVYAGFAGEAGSVGYDLGVISYQYPVTPNSNFTEIYASGTFSIVTAGFAYTVDKASGITDTVGNNDNDLYTHASIDYSLGKSDVSVYIGHYAFDASVPTGATDPDYTHYGASISKDGFTFALDKNDLDASAGATASADNVRFTVSYSMDFEL